MQTGEEENTAHTGASYKFSLPLSVYCVGTQKLICLYFRKHNKNNILEGLPSEVNIGYN